MNLNFWVQLGYSEQEAERFNQSCREGIASYLAENSENVVYNVRYMQHDFDKEFLLKLLVAYSDAFVMPPVIFGERMELLKHTFPDNWTDIVQKQFWGYEGIAGADYEPFLMAVGSHDKNDVINAIGFLNNPASHVFEFMVLLKRECGIEISADNVGEDQLLTLEISKYEIVKNAKALVEKGLPNELIEDILWCVPTLMTLSVKEVEKQLVQSFGTDYVTAMKEAREEGQLEEVLTDISI